MTAPTILLATIGTKGDLHPFIALARALRAEGFRPVLATAAEHVADARAAGIEAAAVLPDFADIARRMGVSEDEAGRRILDDQREMLEQVILPDLGRSAAALDTLAADAVAIVASAFFFAAPIVAEHRGLPLVRVLLQPMALLSPKDAPRTPDFRILARAPAGRIGEQWNRGLLAAMWRGFDLRYGKRINRVRAGFGLPRIGVRRVFEPGAALTLGLWSPRFAPLPPDAPAGMVLTGFPLFDAGCETAGADPLVARFLAAGEAPLVFTLGTFATRAPGGFYRTAEEVARRLGRRAVLLTGAEAPPRVTDDVLALRYLPHSQIFPHAAAVIHHGGAGTVGQALRAGRPQLVVPHMGDQNDHAYRIQALGVGRRVAPARFTAGRVAPILADLLGDAALHERAAALGRAIAAEQGPQTAARAIADTLHR